MNILKIEKRSLFLIIANCLNRFADSIDLLLFTWLVYEISKSPSISALLFAVNKIISICFQPFVGPILEKKSSKKIIMYSDLLRIFAIVLMIGLYFTNSVTIISIALYFCFVSFVETFRVPSGTILLKRIVATNDFEKVVSLNASLTTISEIAGVGIVGFLLVYFKFSVIASFEILCLVFGIFLLTCIKTDEVSSNKREENYFTKLKKGFNYLITNKIVLYLCLISGLINGLVVPFDSLQVAFVNEVLNSSTMMLSVLTVSTSIGTVIGAFFYTKIKLKKHYKFIASGFILGIYYIMIVFCKFTPSFFMYILIGVLSFIVGVSISFLNIYIQTEYVLLTDPNYIGRISAISISISMMFSPISALLTSLLVKFLGISRLFLSSGFLIMAIFIIVNNCLKKIGENKK